MRRCLVIASFFVAAGLAGSGDADACGVAYPAGSYASLARERTVIVWDAAARTEHFIRKPEFDGDAKDFGFFVPTPSVPDVAKVDAELVERVAATAPPATGGGGALQD